MLVAAMLSYPAASLSSVPIARRGTRRSVLLSWDSGAEIGSIVERRSDDTYKVTVGERVIELPSLKTESLASDIWPSSLAAAVLCQNLPRLGSVLELGCGLGLAGLSIKEETASRVVLTDMDEVVIGSLNRIYESNPRVDVRLLDWRDPVPQNEACYDLVLGADVAYYWFLLRPLMDTARKYMRGTWLTIGQANRQSQWDLYDNLCRGCYNQITDENESAWDGTTRVLLYRLRMSAWSDSDSTNPTNDVPIAVIVHTMPGAKTFCLTPDMDYAATQADRESIDISF